MTVTRPVVRWFGGKWKLAPWIISHFPPHRCYVEPFGGGASVLMRKSPSYAEVYNDLDGDIVNLFRILRSSDAKELVRLIELTPFARDEFDASYDEPADDIDRARRLAVKSFMGFGSNAHNSARVTGFRSNSKRSGTTPAKDWRNYPEALAGTIDRLRGVVIENRPADRVMVSHDAADTLHYVDPPYVWDTRAPAKKRNKKYSGYVHEMTDDDHRGLLRFLGTLKGMVIISGYAHPIYEEALRNWVRVETPSYADGARARTEILWMNSPAYVKHLARQPELIERAS